MAGAPVVFGSSRASRGTRSWPARTVASRSPEATAEASWPRSAAPVTSSSPNRSGCSVDADRNRPRTGATARSSTACPVCSSSALSVSRTSRVVANRSSASQSRTRARARWALSTADSGSAPVADHGSSTTAGGRAPAVTAAPSAARSGWDGRPNRSAPNTTQSAGVAAGVAGSAVHSTWNSESGRVRSARSSCSADTGRSASASITATSAPVGSARVTETVSGPAGANRTRSLVALLASSRTSCQEKGTRPLATACRAASASAGCRLNRLASVSSDSPRATSANTSSPRCQTARRPWNTGP